MSVISTVIIRRGPIGPTGPAGANGADGADGQDGSDGSDATVTTSAVASALGIPSYASLTAANTALPIGSLFINTGETPDQLQITTA